MEEVVSRIRIIMENEGHSPASFADTLGIGRPLMSHVLGGRNNPSLQLVTKILEFFPAYSADWLIRGVQKNPVSTSPEVGPKQLFELASESPSAQTEKKVSETAPLSENAVSSGGVQRTMLFYADGTFEEYKPRK